MIYAKVIECYDTSIYFDFEYMGLSIFGNDREFSPIYTEFVKRIVDNLEECTDIISDFESCGGWYTDIYKNVSEGINEVLAPEHKEKYNTREIHKLKELVVEAENGNNEALAEVLTIASGRKYDFECIHGYCQGDWNYIFYDCEAADGDIIRYAEAVYFGTGTEIMIHDEKNTPADADEISGYCFYTADYDLKKAIAEETGENEENIVLYRITGYCTTPVYNIA